jgi:hypothetical protein
MADQDDRLWHSPITERMRINLKQSSKAESGAIPIDHAPQSRWQIMIPGIINGISATAAQWNGAEIRDCVPSSEWCGTVPGPSRPRFPILSGFLVQRPGAGFKLTGKFKLQVAGVTDGAGAAGPGILRL